MLILDNPEAIYEFNFRIKLNSGDVNKCKIAENGKDKYSHIL
jgi:hypothetical protein